MSDKKVVLITGANAGIGFELTKLIGTKPGYKIWVAARTQANGEEAVKTLKAQGIDAHFVQLDITDLASIQKAKEVIEKADGRIDILVNNAGIAHFAENQNALTGSLDIVRDCFETNYYGLIRANQTLVPLVKAAAKAKGHAVIVNVTSDMSSTAFQARPGQGYHLIGYNGSKAAANSYTVSLAQELKADGIKVNSVTPGYTSTKLNYFGEGGKSVVDGAKSVLRFALIDKDGPTCLLFDEHGKQFAW